MPKVVPSFLVLLLSLVPLSALLVGQSGGTTWPLVDVVFGGLDQFPSREAQKLSKLETGQRVSLDDLGAAADRLAQTGLFTEVRYQYKTSANGLIVTFQVAPAPWTTPVSFENFVWMSDDEMRAAIVNRIPAFRMLTDANGRANGYLAGVLEEILLTRNIKARVEARSRLDLTAGSRAFAFVVRDAGVNLRTCSLRVPGASVINEENLAAAAPDLLNSEFLRSHVAAVAAGTLTQRYRQLGYWGATFDAPVGTLGNDCNGVTVTMPVSEGAAYNFGRVIWSGHRAQGEPALNDAFGLKPGTLADIRRVEAGLRAVENSYSNLGYVTAQHSLTHALSEQTREVTFAVTLIEGPQFRMGRLVINGLAGEAAEALARRWPLKGNDVFNPSKIVPFVVEQRRRMGGVELTTATRLDHATALANVTVIVGR